MKPERVCLQEKTGCTPADCCSSIYIRCRSSPQFSHRQHHILQWLFQLFALRRQIHQCHQLGYLTDSHRRYESRNAKLTLRLMTLWNRSSHPMFDLPVCPSKAYIPRRRCQSHTCYRPSAIWFRNYHHWKRERWKSGDYTSNQSKPHCYC
jgi:hypothetical protein